MNDSLDDGNQYNKHEACAERASESGVSSEELTIESGINFRVGAWDASARPSISVWMVTLGGTIEDESFLPGGLAEDHVLAWRSSSQLLDLGFRNFKTFRPRLPYVCSILQLENI